MRFPVGVSIPRREGLAKVSGRASYIDDTAHEELLYGVTVRSTIARGRILSIHFDAEFPWSECTIVTAADLPGPNLVAAILDDQPCLAEVEVNHVEEPIVLIAHQDRYEAERARQSVRIEYEELDAVFDPVASTKIIKSCVIKKGDTAIAFANADHIVEGVYSTSAQEQLYLETQGVVAHCDAERVTVWGSMQCPYFVHKALARLFERKVRVVQVETGGGFGGKEDYPSILATHAALLALKSGRNVKMVYDRAEDIAATTKRHPSITRHRTAVGADGKLLGMEIEFVIDGGAYATLSPVVVSRGAIHASGPYYCPNIRVEARAMATNHPPHGAFRGFGVPQCLFAMERHMDEISRVTGIDRVELRRQNFLKEGETTATGQVLREAVPLDSLLDRALLESKYYEKKKQGRTGLGISAVFHGAGFTGSGERYLKSVASLERVESGKVRVLVSSTEIGQGTNTILSQIVAAEMGIAVDAIEIVQPDTDLVPDSGPTVASRTAMIVGGLLAEAARKLKEPGVSRASAHYVQPEGVAFDESTYTGDAYATYAWAVNIAEVDVDRLSGEVRLLDFVAVQDAGRILHPVLAAGQIEGGAAQGIGFALCEEVVYEDGRVRNTRMSDYIIPGAVDLPMIRVFFEESISVHGPFGAKGLGELPMNGPASAICNAIADQLGIPANHTPMTPERILACCNLSSV